MHKIFPFSLLIILIASSCEFKAEIKTPEANSAAKNASKIRNGIQLTENKLKVSQAFLLYDEDGSLVPETNELAVGKQVVLRLIIDSGFTVTNGKVFLGAAEKVQTNEGTVMLDEKDLFSSYKDGVSPKDASIISLYAQITRLDKLYDYFLVTFRVWDKNGTAEVSGSYKLHIK
ncbi:MAG: hypothetical protein QM726_09710 [Chitinophagaceae bacterium]